MRGRVDEYEIIADGLSQQVQIGLAGGVAALYPDLPQKAACSLAAVSYFGQCHGTRAMGPPR